MTTDPSIMLRITRLEQLVEHLYEHIGLGMPQAGGGIVGGPLNTGVSERVRGLALSGALIDAIKAYREETGADLASAKAVVESIV